MRELLVLSAGLLLGVAAYAWIVYMGAVATGHRSLVHVVFATTYVVLVEIVAVTSVAEASVSSWLLFAANAVGIAAMVALAKRFALKPSDRQAMPEKTTTLAQRLSRPTLSPIERGLVALGASSAIALLILRIATGV